MGNNAVEPLSAQTLETLRAISTPSICNAVEKFNLRRRTEGFVQNEVEQIFPRMGVMVGYALTATASAVEAPTPEQHELRYELLRRLEAMTGPTVIVIQDIDNPPCIGAFWGEVQSNIHKKLGCIGSVTDGGVRDLEEVEALGFQLFARRAIPSHAYVHLVDVGNPVSIGGLVVHTGDLLHADKHGVTTIPIEIAPEVPEKVRDIEANERKIISYCSSSNFSIDGLHDLREGKKN